MTGLCPVCGYMFWREWATGRLTFTVDRERLCMACAIWAWRVLTRTP